MCTVFVLNKALAILECSRAISEQPQSALEHSQSNLRVAEVCPRILNIRVMISTA